MKNLLFLFLFVSVGQSFAPPFKNEVDANLTTSAGVDTLDLGCPLYVNGYNVTRKAGNWTAYIMNATDQFGSQTNAMEWINRVTHQSIGYGLQRGSLSIGYTPNVLNTSLTTSTNIYIDTLGNFLLNNKNKCVIYLADSALTIKNGNVIFSFPTSPGSVGQVLKVGQRWGNRVKLKWGN